MTEPYRNTNSIIVDTDCGIDDALAIALLWAAGSADRVLAVTTVGGNTTAAQSAHNARTLLALLGWNDVPVIAGSELTSQGQSFETGELVHGADGMGGVIGSAPSRLPAERDAGDHAARQIISLSQRSPGLELICLGPLTNIALALEMDPSFPDRVHSITAMGGAVHHPGNGTPAAEANIRNDAHAAQAVLNAGWDMTLVPLDATMTHRIRESDVRSLQHSPNAGIALIGSALPTYLRFHQGWHFDEAEAALHDPLTVAVALRLLDGVCSPRLRVEVDTRQGQTRGMTIADTRRRYLGYPTQGNENTAVVLDVCDDVSTLMTNLLMERG